MGRKKLPDPLIKRTIGVRFPQETISLIHQLAQRDSRTPSAVVRRLVEIGLAIEHQIEQRSAAA